MTFSSEINKAQTNRLVAELAKRIQDEGGDINEYSFEINYLPVHVFAALRAKHEFPKIPKIDYQHFHFLVEASHIGFANEALNLIITHEDFTLRVPIDLENKTIDSTIPFDKFYEVILIQLRAGLEPVKLKESTEKLLAGAST